MMMMWRAISARPYNKEVVILELVFFTRFELRKGIVLFCDLLDQLALRGDRKDMEGMKVGLDGCLLATSSTVLLTLGC